MYKFISEKKINGFYVYTNKYSSCILIYFSRVTYILSKPLYYYDFLLGSEYNK